MIRNKLRLPGNHAAFDRMKHSGLFV